MTDKAPAGNEKPEKAAWTVMVYLAGDNNLTVESVYAMTEMKKVGSGNGINIITQFDPSDDYLPTHRYHIGRKGNTNSLACDILSTSKFGRFGEESVSAGKLEAIRIGARKAAKKVARDEARRLARAKVAGKVARGMAQQSHVLGKVPVILETEDEVGVDVNDTDTGSPVTLYNFMSLCVQNFPAHHYMVILSGHGSGNARDFLLKDESPTGSLTINELKRAFEELKSELNGQVIDILGMDACLMSMAEVTYELRGLVKIMVGAESYTPASGWPYEMILRKLKEVFATVKPEDEKHLAEKDRVEYKVAKSIVEEYVNFYADYSLGGLSVDLSAMDVGVVKALKRHIDGFAGAMTRELKNGGNGRFKDDLLLAHWEAQSYNGELFVDIFDFCDCLLRRLGTGDVSDRGRKLMDFISQNFVLKSCFSGARYQYSYGVSIYFPWSRIERDYANLDFAQTAGRSGKSYRKSGWLRFLETYVRLTRRQPREVGNQNKFMRLNQSESQRVRRTDDRGPGNPVHSMRNPPIVAFPKECINEDEIKNLTVGIEQLLSG